MLTETRGYINLHAYPALLLPAGMPHMEVSREPFDLDCFSRDYSLRDVTGLDPRVVAHVSNQANAAKAVREAVIMVETDHYADFAFVCHGGTHRSGACVMLCAVLAYPHGEIRMHTSRTARAWWRAYGLMVYEP